MSIQTIIANGVIRGRSVELDRDVALPEGANVAVSLQLATKSKEEWLEGLRKLFGAWKDEEGFDEFLEMNRASRKLDREPLA